MSIASPSTVAKPAAAIIFSARLWAGDDDGVTPFNGQPRCDVCGDASMSETPRRGRRAGATDEADTMSGLMNIKVFCLLLGFSFCPTALAQEGRRALPDPGLTPGDAGEVMAAEICKVEYENPDSNVPTGLKYQVYTRYHVSRYEVGYNVDHLIPVKLGGTNSIENLWPQPLSGEWGWHRKNELEHRLRKLVCGGSLGLEQAQQEIATDWISAYRKYVGKGQ